MPPPEDAVILWGSSFKPGRTFRNYLSHIGEAFPFLSYPTKWYAIAVKEVATGLRLAQRIPFKFPNSIYTRDIYMIINSLGWRSEFAQLFFVSFLFPP